MIKEDTPEMKGTLYLKYHGNGFGETAELEVYVTDRVVVNNKEYTVTERSLQRIYLNEDIEKAFKEVIGNAIQKSKSETDIVKRAIEIANKFNFDIKVELEFDC